MKTKILIAAIIFAFITMAATPITNGFDFVRSHRQGKGATITWAYTTPGASSFVLQRTCEDPNDPYAVWEPVTSMQNNSSRSYKHHDAAPGFGYINYRIVAVMNDGSTTTSEVTTLRIVSH
jgi:hypothetical protein